MDEKCENCDERYECNSGLGCLKAMSPQPAPSEPQGEPLIGGGRVDPETGVYTANEKRLGGMNNSTKNMPFTLRNGTVLNKQPAPSGPPVEEGFPKIVCLCGSTKFYETFQKANFQETLAGNIVLSIGCDTKSDDSIFASMSIEEMDRVKDNLDALHFRKIELADEVLILNVGGYIGKSTNNEIDHADKLGKPIRYWEPK